MSYNIVQILILYKKQKEIVEYKTFIGMIISILTAGCVACGGAILFSILSILGISIISLPLEGGSFFILSIIILLYSNYKIRKQK
jgi:hypothetical protein